MRKYAVNVSRYFGLGRLTPRSTPIKGYATVKPMAQKGLLYVQILHLAGMRFDELPARLYLVAQE